MKKVLFTIFKPSYSTFLFSSYILFGALFMDHKISIFSMAGLMVVTVIVDGFILSRIMKTINIDTVEQLEHHIKHLKELKKYLKK